MSREAWGDPPEQEPQRCPVCDGEWHAEGCELGEEVSRRLKAERRACKAEKVLRELVELEDMRLRLRQLHEMGHGTDYADYHRLLPLAWAAAREVLGPNDRANRDTEAR